MPRSAYRWVKVSHPVLHEYCIFVISWLSLKPRYDPSSILGPILTFCTTMLSYKVTRTSGCASYTLPIVNSDGAFYHLCLIYFNIYIELSVFI